MVLSQPYLTLVAIGLSGIPYTGSPAHSSNQKFTSAVGGATGIIITDGI